MREQVVQAIAEILKGVSVSDAVTALLEGRRVTRWWQAHAGDLVTDITMGQPVGVGRVHRQDKNARVQVTWVRHPHFAGKTFWHTQGELRKLRKPGEGGTE